MLICFILLSTNTESQKFFSKSFCYSCKNSVADSYLSFIEEEDEGVINGVVGGMLKPVSGTVPDIPIKKKNSSLTFTHK